MKKKIIFGLIGPSQSGKSMFITEVVKQLGTNRIRPIKSFTTRRKRNQDEDWIYDFITQEEFKERMEDGDVIQCVKYAGHIYGNSHDSVKSVLKDSHGIIALIEESVFNFRNAGYIVKPIKIIPMYQDVSHVSDLRKDEDARRSQTEIDFAFKIRNSFKKGGRVRAIAKLVDFIKKF